MTPREVWLRLTFPLRRGRVARELRQELDLHVELRARALLDSAQESDAARAALAAKHQFGNATRIEGAARDAWGWHWLDGVGQDLRYVARQLAHSPVFALIAIATIGLGIAVNAAAFTFYDAIVLKPLPVRDPQSIVRIVQDRSIPRPEELPFAAYDAFRRGSRTLSAVVTTTSPQTFSVVLPGRVLGDGRVASARFVSPDFAAALGIGAAVGRWFGAADDAVVVLDYRFWQGALNGDVGVIGRRLTIDNRELTIVGVADERFAGTGLPAVAPDMWIPMSVLPTFVGADWRYDGRAHWQVLGRLAPEASLTQLGNEVQSLRGGIVDTLGKPLTITAKRATFFQSDAGEFEVFQQVSAAFITALSLILGIGVVNLVNVFAARHADREREIAVRLALGASRGHIARQLASESLLLATFGGALGLVASRWLVVWLRNWLSGTMSTVSGGLVAVFLDLGVDWRVTSYTVLLSVAIGLCVGLWPALRSSRVDANAVLREGGTSTATRAVWGKRSILLGAQVASCTILLAGAGLLLGGMRRAPRIDPGFDAARMLVVFSDVTALTPNQRAQLRAKIEREIIDLPKVQTVAWSKRVPLSGSETRTVTSPEGQFSVSLNYASASYFDALGVRLARGRMFTAAEVAANAPVMLVNRTMARTIWPGQDPIGKTIAPHRASSGPDTTAVYTVIGVVQDMRTDYLSRDNGPTTYYPYDPGDAYGALLIRTRGMPAAAINSVRVAINRVSPTAFAQTRVTTMVDGPMALQVLMAQAPGTVALGLALAGLALATIGIYGVIASLVTRRTREIGVRIALGASAAQVIALVARKTLRPVAIGAVVGIIGSISVSFLLRSLISVPDAPDLTFGAGAFSPVVFAEVLGTLAAVVLLACYLPARRAVRVDPTVALRSE